ncbi:MAG: GtrA family protein [Pseudoflavonifractor sp.]
MKEKLLQFLQIFDLRKFAKFGLIGVVNTLLDLGVFYVMNKIFLLDPYLSQIISFFVGALNSFLWNKFWTFEKRGSVTGREVLRYVVTNGGYLLLSLGLLRLLVGALSVDPFLAKLPTTAFMLLYNYLMNKFWVFR